MRPGAAAAGLLCLAFAGGCTAPAPTPPARSASLTPAESWNAGTVYFLLLDRFADGDRSNDHALGRAHDGAVLRSFEGGDLAGVRQKIEAGWFDSLGVTAIWLSPFVEQIHGAVDEGSGRTYGFHGYWTRDWTRVDPAFGTADDLSRLVTAAHRHGIRVLMDAVLNHTGPATPQDPAWPDAWVRHAPQCTYASYATTVTCALVKTLPDVRTESDAPVDLPPDLIAAWRAQGRLEQERASLDSFFQRTGYPRAPRYYIIKWLTDWVRRYGIDGYRMDTAKHFEPSVSAELKRQAAIAYDDWKREHPGDVPGNLPFYLVGEVYGWAPEQGRSYNYGDRSVDFFDFGYDGLINFAFKQDASWPLDSLFSTYSLMLHGPLAGETFLNYLSSHDDGGPWDRDRRHPLEAATRLLLAPGSAQIYYGDELARPLQVAGAQGDANLRSLMDWNALESDNTRRILQHWRKLGRFRRDHPAVGAGVHHTLQDTPFIFSRILDTAGVHDRVLVALDQPDGEKTIPVFGLFPDGTRLWDAYSGRFATVRNGKVVLSGPAGPVLLAP